jgi:hypothetical protein
VPRECGAARAVAWPYEMARSPHADNASKSLHLFQAEREFEILFHAPRASSSSPYASFFLSFGLVHQRAVSPGNFGYHREQAGFDFGRRRDLWGAASGKEGPRQTMLREDGEKWFPAFR